jgi:hypothetical protein
MVYGGTAHNRSVYASGAVAPSGYEKPQSAQAPLWGFSPPHFGPPQCYALLYGRAKTSYTAGTLCEIGAKIFCK